MSETQPTPETQQERGARALIEGWMDNVAGFIRGPAGLMAGVMALLALVGTAVSLADATWARAYWLALVPIYGLLCIFAAWRRTGDFTGTVLRQVLHWLSVAAAIALDVAYLRRSGEPAAGGLSSLLILALGSLLAGIHLEWLFALVGLLLFVIFAVVGLAHQYVTLAFLIVAAAALIFAAYWALMRR